MGNESNLAMEKSLPYRCVHCSQSASSLYKVFDGKKDQRPSSNIKLSDCSKCGEVVDPYIEREWLHVAIDCVLFRKAAYRHVLYNIPELGSNMLFAIQCGVGWAALEAYLDSGVIWREEAKSAVKTDYTQVSFVAATFAVKLCELAMQAFIAASLMKSSTFASDQALCFRVYYAFLLPSSFSIISVLVGIWEKTWVVLLLSSILVFCWQGSTLSLLCHDESKPFLRTMVTCLAVKIVLRITSATVMKRCLLLHLQCSDFLFGGSFSWMSFFCLL